MTDRVMPERVFRGESAAAGVSEAMRAEAHAALASRLERAADQRQAAKQPGDRAMRALHESMRRLVGSDAEYRETIAALRAESQQVSDIDRSHRIDVADLSDEEILGRLRNDTGGPRMDLIQDAHLDWFAAPYASSWTDIRGTGRPHQREQAWAEKKNGEMGWSFQIFPERGDIVCSSAIWVDFMRTHAGYPPGQAPEGIAQIRTYTPYEYIRNNQSDLERADSAAWWGIYVVSWDIRGGPMAVEQEYHYPAPVWSDTTDWNWNDANPSWPAVDSGLAFPWYGPETPTFKIKPERMYSAAIWCWGTGDAMGQLDEYHGSFAMATFWAHVRMVVVAQN